MVVQELTDPRYSAFVMYRTLIIGFAVVMILSLTPNPSLSSLFQTDKLISGYIDANFGPPVTPTY